MTEPSPDQPEAEVTPPDEPPADAGRLSPAAVARLVALVLVLVAAAVALQLSGWNGPEELRSLVESAGWAGVLVFVLGYALLVLAPAPASVLTILGGALFGVWVGALVAWVGAVLGALGGFAIGRRLGRPAVDRLLGGRLQQADRVLARHGVVAVLAVRLVPLFPFTPLNYAAGLVGVRRRDYAVGTALGILPGSVAYAAVGASGADPLGIVLGVGGLLLLAVLGATVGRRLLARSADDDGPEDAGDAEDAEDTRDAGDPAGPSGPAQDR